MPSAVRRPPPATPHPRLTAGATPPSRGTPVCRPSRPRTPDPPPRWPRWRQPPPAAAWARHSRSSSCVSRRSASSAPPSVRARLRPIRLPAAGRRTAWVTRPRPRHPRAPGSLPSPGAAVRSSQEKPCSRRRAECASRNRTGVPTGDRMGRACRSLRAVCARGRDEGVRLVGRRCRDVFQEVFVQTWSRMKGPDAGQDLHAWMVSPHHAGRQRATARRARSAGGGAYGGRATPARRRADRPRVGASAVHRRP